MVRTRSFKQAVEQQGGTLHYSPSARYAGFSIEAQQGKVWSCSSTHSLSMGWSIKENGAPVWPEERDNAILDAMERIAMGTVACDDEECDWCHPEVDEAP